jgi:hypothetical protein
MSFYYKKNKQKFMVSPYFILFSVNEYGMYAEYLQNTMVQLNDKIDDFEVKLNNI